MVPHPGTVLRDKERDRQYLLREAERFHKDRNASDGSLHRHPWTAYRAAVRQVTSSLCGWNRHVRANWTARSVQGSETKRAAFDRHLGGVVEPEQYPGRR